MTPYHLRISKEPHPVLLGGCISVRNARCLADREVSNFIYFIYYRIAEIKNAPIRSLSYLQDLVYFTTIGREYLTLTGLPF